MQRYFIKVDFDNEDLNTEEMIVCLDNISDPGNVGAIIRNCDWFGIKEIILSDGCADIYNPKSLRASMGSIFHLRILENRNLKLYFSKIKITMVYNVLCTDLEGENIFDFKSFT